MAQIVPLRVPQEAADTPNSSGRAHPSRLTKRAVEALRPPRQGEGWLWDGELRGFGVRVSSRGVRTYIVQYRDSLKKTRRMALGRHGVLTVDEARRLAIQALAAVATGGNPSVERRRARDEAGAAAKDTVGSMLRDYLAYSEARGLKASSLARYRSSLELHLLPVFDQTAISHLTTDAVRAWHTALSATPTTANRALALLSAACEHAGIANPCRGKQVKRFPENKRTRFLTAEELRRVTTVLATGEPTQQGTRPFRPGVTLATKLLLLTGCRVSEILSLRWQDVDLEMGVLNLPDAKSGARMVPLSEVARQILAGLTRDSPYVVPGVRPGTPLNLATYEGAWARIRTLAAIPDVRVHDLRHTVGTFAGAAGLNSYAVRDLLGHKTLAMSSRYVSIDIEPSRRAADQAVARIAAALGIDPASGQATNSDGNR